MGGPHANRVARATRYSSPEDIAAGECSGVCIDPLFDVSTIVESL